jgi:hypothetical protein
MSEKKEPQTKEEYYFEALQDFPEIRNANARRIYFEETEPEEGKGRDTRILSATTAKTIAQQFLNRIILDLLTNSRYEWKVGSNIPDPEHEFPWGGPKQPLGQGQVNGTEGT